VWEDGGSNPGSYPIANNGMVHIEVIRHLAHVAQGNTARKLKSAEFRIEFGRGMPNI
jgi:hypothetical protein